MSFMVHDKHGNVWPPAFLPSAVSVRPAFFMCQSSARATTWTMESAMP